MKHATPECLDALEPLLEEIRRHTTLKERSRGVFYLRSRAMLHFHEDPAGVFADLHKEGGWHRFPVNSRIERRELLRQLSLCLRGEVRP
jgi:hypothetical protein